jgi:hypothetical protein
MRGCVIGGAVLAVVVVLVTVNAVFVGNTVEALTERAEALPDTPDPTVTPDEIASIREFLTSREALLGLSVSYAVMDKVAETLYGLEAAARSGDVYQYRETLALLRDLTEDLGRLERVSIRNIL